jgi:hypothetical protein
VPSGPRAAALAPVVPPRPASAPAAVRARVAAALCAPAVAPTRRCPAPTRPPPPAPAGSSSRAPPPPGRGARHVAAVWTRPTPDRNEDWVKPSYIPSPQQQPIFQPREEPRPLYTPSAPEFRPAEMPDKEKEMPEGPKMPGARCPEGWGGCRRGRAGRGRGRGPGQAAGREGLGDGGEVTLGCSGLGGAQQAPAHWLRGAWCGLVDAGGGRRGCRGVRFFGALRAWPAGRQALLPLTRPPPGRVRTAERRPDPIPAGNPKERPSEGGGGEERREAPPAPSPDKK